LPQGKPSKGPESNQKKLALLTAPKKKATHSVKCELGELHRMSSVAHQIEKQKKNL
jgi:hypothetical protein